jgi:hypothetical protein
MWASLRPRCAGSAMRPTFLRRRFGDAALTPLPSGAIFKRNPACGDNGNMFVAGWARCEERQARVSTLLSFTTASSLTVPTGCHSSVLLWHVGSRRWHLCTRTCMSSRFRSVTEVGAEPFIRSLTGPHWFRSRDTVPGWLPARNPGWFGSKAGSGFQRDRWHSCPPTRTCRTLKMRPCHGSLESSRSAFSDSVPRSSTNASSQRLSSSSEPEAELCSLY